MDLESNQIRVSLQHAQAQSLPSGSQFKTQDVSLDMESIPLPDKINFHRKVGKILYNELNNNSLTIIKVEKLLEKVAHRLNQEKSNSRDLDIKNENFKDLVVKLGVKTEDRLAIETFLKGSQVDIQELRNKKRMLSNEHV